MQRFLVIDDDNGEILGRGDCPDQALEDAEGSIDADDDNGEGLFLVDTAGALPITVAKPVAKALSVSIPMPQGGWHTGFHT